MSQVCKQLKKNTESNDQSPLKKWKTLFNPPITSHLLPLDTYKIFTERIYLPSITKYSFKKDFKYLQTIMLNRATTINRNNIKIAFNKKKKKT